CASIPAVQLASAWNAPLHARLCTCVWAASELVAEVGSLLPGHSLGVNPPCMKRAARRAQAAGPARSCAHWLFTRASEQREHEPQGCEHEPQGWLRKLPSRYPPARNVERAELCGCGAAAFPIQRCQAQCSRLGWVDSVRLVECTLAATMLAVWSQLEFDGPEEFLGDPVSSILWDTDDFYVRDSKVVEVPEDLEPADALVQAELPDWMERHQGWVGGPRGVIVLVGVSDSVTSWLAEGQMPDSLTRDQARRRLDLIFGRGIVRAAIQTRSVIVTSGLDLGVASHVGRANMDAFHKCPLLGVSPKGAVTWPGDARPHAPKCTPLESNHTHHLLVHTANDVAGVTKYRIDLIKELVRNRVLGPDGNESAPLPVMVVVVNGSEAALMEVVQFVRVGWPVMVMKGTGGAADDIAHACAVIKDEFVPNPRLVEIAKEGRVECVNILDCEGGGTRVMISRLFLGGGGLAFYDPNLVFAWEQAVKYRANGATAATYGHNLEVGDMGLWVLATAIVSFRSERGDWVFGDLATLGMWLALLLAPVISVVLVLTNGAFRWRSRAAALKGAVEAAVSEIYQYRAGMGPYMNAPDEQRNDLLAANLTELGKFVLTSGVGDTGLRLNAVNAARKQSFRVSKDDDGFSVLAPDDYLRNRVEVQIKGFQAISLQLEKLLRYLQIMGYALGGLGTILAGAGGMYYVAITTIFQLSVNQYIRSFRLDDKLAFYNQASTQAETLQSWWLSLTSIQTASPLNYAVMVKTMEDVKNSEMLLLNPSAGGGGGGSGDPPTFNLAEFKSDVGDAIQKDGRVKFKQGWVEKYEVFFSQYEDYLAQLNFFEPQSDEPCPLQAPCAQPGAGLSTGLFQEPL
ncbi:hypothetical protein CYMTET_13074, partial [Cymbomonas tetramitiformis]